MILNKVVPILRLVDEIKLLHEMETGYDQKYFMIKSNERSEDSYIGPVDFFYSTKVSKCA